MTGIFHDNILLIPDSLLRANALITIVSEAGTYVTMGSENNRCVTGMDV